jgi:hypothetical protein
MYRFHVVVVFVGWVSGSVCRFSVWMVTGVSQNIYLRGCLSRALPNRNHCGTNSKFHRVPEDVGRSMERLGDRMRRPTDKNPELRL